MVAKIRNLEDSLYWYRAKVNRVVDGDTFDMAIDLGFGLGYRNERIRLLDVNAYEIRKKASTTKKMRKLKLDWKNYPEKGKEAQELAYQLLFGEVENIIIKTRIKKVRGSFGRILAHVFYKNENKKWVDFGKLLVKQGLAYEDKR